MYIALYYYSFLQLIVLLLVCIYHLAIVRFPFLLLVTLCYFFHFFIRAFFFVFILFFFLVLQLLLDILLSIFLGKSKYGTYLVSSLFYRYSIYLFVTHCLSFPFIFLLLTCFAFVFFSFVGPVTLLLFYILFCFLLVLISLVCFFLPFSVSSLCLVWLFFVFFFFVMFLLLCSRMLQNCRKWPWGRGGCKNQKDNKRERPKELIYLLFPFFFGFYLFTFCLLFVGLFPMFHLLLSVLFGSGPPSISLFFIFCRFCCCPFCFLFCCVFFFLSLLLVLSFFSFCLHLPFGLFLRFYGFLFMFLVLVALLLVFLSFFLLFWSVFSSILFASSLNHTHKQWGNRKEVDR